MATGSTYDFEQSRDEIIKDALASLGVLGPEREVDDGQMLTHAARALNRVVKSIDPEGNVLWRLVRRTTTTTDGTATFTPAADVIAIDEPMSFIQAGTTARTPMHAMSR